MASDPPRPLRLEGLDQANATALSDTSLLTPRTPSGTFFLKGFNNPLTTKVASVLSTSYADSEFRDALALLDERHLQNGAETRRRLRIDVQKEVIDSNGEVILEFARVSEQLKRIGSTIGKLNATYDNIRSQIDTAHTATQPVLQEASALIERRRHVETRRHLLNAFVGHFVLSEDDVASLTLTSEPVDDRFFAVLNRAKKISKDCEILLGFEDNQALGLEIMEQTSKNINLGFQKLYKWVQREFKNLNLENPQIGLAMNRALRVLAERPSLFQSCLDSFAEARETILSDAFYVALTGNDDGLSDRQINAVKPIELAAHDPLRYAGDMLAWTHSATVSEREALESLFVADGGELARGIQEGRENEGWLLVSDEGQNETAAAFDPVKALNNLVDRDLSGVARILRQRMEQVFQTNEETILAYKIANLLNFYRITFAKLLGISPKGEKNEDTGSTLVDTLRGLEADALRHFRSLVRDHVISLRGDFQHAPQDLTPPEFLQDALEQLVSIMKTYDTSLAAPEDRESDFVPILADALDPYLAGCEEMAEKADEALQRPIFLVNCLLATRETLSTYDFAAGRVSRLQATVDVKSHAITENQYAFFCQRSGLQDLFVALREISTKNKEDFRSVLQLEVLKPDLLVEASQSLDEFLPSALMDAIENLKALQDPKLARKLTEEAAERFCTDFQHLEDVLDAADQLLLEDDADRDPDTALRALFPRTSVEIRVLLS